MSKDIIIPEMDRRAFLKRVGIGSVATAFALATIKPVLAETVITDKHIKTGETNEIVSKSSTVVVGKSGAVDYLTTDYVSDDACIQAAIDYVNGLGGGSMLIREGTYTIESTINIPSNITIDLGTATLFLDNGVNSNILRNVDWISGNSNIHIINGIIDCNRDNNTNPTCYENGITFWFGANISIIGTEINNVSGHGITFRELTKAFASYIISDNVACENIIMWDTDNFMVSNCICSNAGGTGIMVYQTIDTKCFNGIISNNISHEHAENGIRLAGNVGTIRDIEIETNIAYNNTQSGIYIHQCDTINVINSCVYNNNSFGISVYSASTNIIISNCTSYDNDYDGIRFNNVSHCICQGNSLKNNQLVGGIGSIGLYDATYTVVGNNEIQQAASITEQNISNFNSINSNIISGTISYVGTNTRVENNIGFNPVGNFTAPSIPATTVNYTNAYGYLCQVQVYGGTVTEIDVDDIATGLTAGIFMIPPGGTINITYSAAPSWQWWGL